MDQNQGMDEKNPEIDFKPGMNPQKDQKSNNGSKSKKFDENPKLEQITEMTQNPEMH